MFTDVVGYTALSQYNEALAMELLEEHRKLMRPFFPKYNGREVKTIGDAFLVEFASALEAVRCAFAMQNAMHDLNSKRPEARMIQIRIGVHSGDVIHSQNDVYGDAVNVASRIESLADPGGICVSEEVYKQTKNKFELPMSSIGKKELKNVTEPVEVFRVVEPWQQSGSQDAGHFPRDRIAILPFRSMSPDPTDEYLAEGITEEIISTVSGISGLSVISRTSVMGYKGTTKRVGEIGKELKVGSVLEGSFRKAGNRIRVTTQLIDVEADKHLWAQNYDRNLDDVFEVQSDVAKQVAEALRVKVLSPEMERMVKKPTENTAAYTHYLKGRSLWNKRGIDDLKQARRYFEDSIREDPNFALGYVGIADCSLLLRNNWSLDSQSNLKIAREMVAKALELDQSCAEAHATRGLLLTVEYKHREAEEEYKRAIELKPSYATAHQWYFQVLENMGRRNEAHEQIEKALELDPLSPIINENYGGYYFFDVRDYRRALDLYKRAAELGMLSAHGMMAMAYGKLKMFEDMRKEGAIVTRETKDSFPMGDVGDEAFFAWMEGDLQKLRIVLPKIEEHPQETGWNNTLLAMAFAQLGDKDRVFELLEKAFAENEGHLSGLKTGEFFDGIRSDPRYFDLLKRLGLD